jgi:hypothetical protein
LAGGKKTHGAAVVWSELLTFRGWPYPSFWPNNFRVFRLIKCNLVQAGQVIASYSFSDALSSSSSQCWTIIDVSGQVKMISPQSGLIGGRDLGSEL